MVIVRWAVIVLFAILVAVARQAAISRPVVASERQDTPRAAALTDDTRTERAAATLGGEPLAPAGFGWG